MSELESMTLREAVGVLRERVEHHRSVEETARRERERDEAALAALEALIGDERSRLGEESPTTKEGPPPGRKRFLGLTAVRQVMRESPDRVWTPREVHEVLEERGWLSNEAKHPRAGTESAVGRLLSKGEIEKVARGQYRWLSRQEAPIES